MIFGGGILGSSLFAGCNNDDPVTPDMHSLKSYSPKRASMFRPKEDLSKSNTRSKTPSQMRPCLPNATTVG